jgi:hypothetical protein
MDYLKLYGAVGVRRSPLLKSYNNLIVELSAEVDQGGGIRVLPLLGLE